MNDKAGQQRVWVGANHGACARAGGAPGIPVNIPCTALLRPLRARAFAVPRNLSYLAVALTPQTR